MVGAARVQDRDGGRGILTALHGALGSVRHVFADGGYQGQLVAVAKSAWGIVVEVVRKPAGQRGFAVLPRRWVVERTLAWLMRFRRLARDYERLLKGRLRAVREVHEGPYVVRKYQFVCARDRRRWLRSGRRDIS